MVEQLKATGATRVILFSLLACGEHFFQRYC